VFLRKLYFRFLQIFFFIVMLGVGIVVFAVPTRSFDSSKEESNQILNLSTNDFGLQTPLSIGAQWSHLFGLSIQGKYTQALNYNNAISLELELGKNQHRENITWGYLFNCNQRFKLTAENLAQHINFDFDSGETTKWVYQSAVGGTYQYSLKNYFIDNINLNFFYNKAFSRDLDAKNFYQESGFWRNDRRIAGGVDRSVSLGADLLPTAKSLVGLRFNYDNVNYDTKYVANKDTGGFGATVSIEQLIADKIKIKILASNRKIYDDYEVDLNWLPDNFKNSQLELSFLGERIIGKQEMPNDIRLGLNFTFDFASVVLNQDANQSESVAYTLSSENAAVDLASWTSEPAVYMQQVLAIEDQKTERIDNASKIKGVAAEIAVGVNPNFSADPNPIMLKLDEPISSQLNKTWFYAIMGKEPDHPNGQNLNGMFQDPRWYHHELRTQIDEKGVLSDSGLQIQHVKGSAGTLDKTIISGTPIKVGIYAVQIDAANNAVYFGQWSAHQTLKITVYSDPVANMPVQHFFYHQQVDEDISQYVQPGKQAAFKDIQLDLSKYGLRIEFDKASAYIKGLVAKPTITERTIPITVTNNFSRTTKSNFKLDISGPPIKQKDSASVIAEENQFFIPVPLADCFRILPGSDAISGWNIEVKSQDGKVDLKDANAVQQYMGLTISYNQLRGVLKNVTAHSPYKIYLIAKNSYGSSIDLDGNPASVVMALTVTNSQHQFAPRRTRRARGITNG
jgi:hypothetical protein